MTRSKSLCNCRRAFRESGHVCGQNGVAKRRADCGGSLSRAIRSIHTVRNRPPLDECGIEMCIFGASWSVEIAEKAHEPSASGSEEKRTNGAKRLRFMGIAFDSGGGANDGFRG